MDVPSTGHHRQMSAEPITRIQCGRNEQRKGAAYYAAQ